MYKEDPEGIEIKEVQRLVQLRGKDVLEIGCGDGRLTFQYAGSAKSVVAVDPSRKSISLARKNTPKSLLSKVKFRVGRGEDLGFPDETFDVVFFSWSLCCTAVPAMGRAVHEAWHVLRPKGKLVSIQSSLHQPFSKGMISYLLDRNFGPGIWDEGDRQARMALRHSSFVERMFDYITEVEFPVYSYYDTLGEAVRGVVGESGEKYQQLDEDTKRRIREILGSMKTHKGIRIQENAVLTALRKV